MPLLSSALRERQFSASECWSLSHLRRQKGPTLMRELGEGSAPRAEPVLLAAGNTTQLWVSEKWEHGGRHVFGAHAKRALARGDDPLYCVRLTVSKAQSRVSAERTRGHVVNRRRLESASMKGRFFSRCKSTHFYLQFSTSSCIFHKLCHATSLRRSLLSIIVLALFVWRNGNARRHRPPR